MKEIQIRIQPDIYPINLYVGSINIEKFEEFLIEDLTKELADKHISNIKAMEKGGGACYSLEGDSIVIFFFCKENDINRSYEVIAHEIYHATMGYASILGLKYSYKSEEAFAYLNGYFSDIIFNELRPDWAGEVVEETTEIETNTVTTTVVTNCNHTYKADIPLTYTN
jgi:hypothetical protein